MSTCSASTRATRSSRRAGAVRPFLPPHIYINLISIRVAADRYTRNQCFNKHPRLCLTKETSGLLG